MSIELGPVWLLGADAVGRPGQRRFRLFVQSARGSAILWMEKEQLNSLSLSLDSVLAHLTEGQVLRIEARSGEQPQPGKMPADFPRVPTHELQVGQLKLGYDEDRDVFLISAIPLELEIEGEEEAAASHSFSRRAMHRSFPWPSLPLFLLDVRSVRSVMLRSMVDPMPASDRMGIVKSCRSSQGKKTYRKGAISRAFPRSFR
jgi:hypothetical protein